MFPKSPSICMGRGWVWEEPRAHSGSEPSAPTPASCASLEGPSAAGRVGPRVGGDMECVDGTSFQILWSLSCFELGWENVSLLPGFCQHSTHRPNLQGPTGPKGGGQNRHGAVFPDINTLFIIAACVCHMGLKQPVLQRRLLGPHRPPC